MILSNADLHMLAMAIHQRIHSGLLGNKTLEAHEELLKRLRNEYKQRTETDELTEK